MATTEKAIGPEWVEVLAKGNKTRRIVQNTGLTMIIITSATRKPTGEHAGFRIDPGVMLEIAATDAEATYARTSALESVLTISEA